MIEKYFSTCLYFTAHRLARLMSKMAEEAFASIGLSPSYAFLIMVVEEQPGITQTELSEKLHLAPSTCTRLVDKLVTRDIVERKHEGKQVMIYPTQKSNQMLEQIHRCWKELYRRYSEVLGEEEAKELTKQMHLASEKLE